MKSSPEDKKRRFSASPQFHCVWMTAGVLAYQLCDRQFDCDSCQLEGALRAMFAKQRKAPALAEITGSPLPDSYKLPSFLYSRNHCWVHTISDTVARVGIEPGFASVLLSPKAVVLPSPEDRIKQNECCFWVVLEGGTIPVKSPLNGVVRRTNSRVAQEPHEMCLHPENEGWLFELEINKGEFPTEHLLHKKDIEEAYSGDMILLRSLVTAALQEHTDSVGMTLADGGQALPSVSAMLGPQRYYEMICEVFS